jgi:hypothetical protein
MIAAPSSGVRAKTMSSVYFCVDVLMERVALHNRWASEQWQPWRVLPVSDGRGSPRAPELLLDTAERSLWRFPAMEIELHTSEGEGYYLNLTSEKPVVFVLWRPQEEPAAPAVRPLIVTLSYNEASRFMDAGEKVDPVPLPEEIRAWAAPFVAQHYTPAPRKKHRRNDPFADDGMKH